MVTRSRALGLAIAVLGVALFLAAPATGARLAVNGVADVVADDGVCTLREAITAANTDTPSGNTPGECAAGSGADTAAVPSGRYVLAVPGAHEDANATGDLDITSDLTLEGAGALTTRIGAQRLDRVLDVLAGSVTISGVTISGGRTPNGTDGQNNGAPGGVPPTDGEPGGGIRNAGTLTVDESVVTDNTTGRGGNVSVASGVTPTSVLQNARGGPGGGIFSDASIRVVRSTIDHNWTGSGGGPGLGDHSYDANGGAGGDGGGVANPNGSLTILASTVDDNASGYGGSPRHADFASESVGGAGGCGGGIYSGGNAKLTNTTITANLAGSHDAEDDGQTCGGGGIYAFHWLRLNQVTLAGDFPGREGSGGIDWGRFQEVAAGGDAVARNTLIVTHDAFWPYVVCGGLADGGHNLSYTSPAPPPGAGCPSTTDTDPQLGRLADNGDPTRTMALTQGTEPVDAVPASGAECAEADQRGVTRPQGPACDIGAFELVPVPVNSAPPSISGTAQEGETLTAAPGSWAYRPTSFAYQWERCDAAGTACSAIAGATSASYLAGAGDIGHVLVVAVSATNDGGTSAPAESAPTAALAARPTTPSTSGSTTSTGGSSTETPGTGDAGGSSSQTAGTTNAGAGAGAGTGTGTGAGDIPLLPTPLAAPTLTARRQSLSAILRRGAIRAACALDRAGTCRVTATIPRRVARALGHRAARVTVLGTGRTALAAAGSHPVTITLRSSARRLLAHIRRGLRITLRAVAVAAGEPPAVSTMRMTVT